jgi:hypothetical protein
VGNDRALRIRIVIAKMGLKIPAAQTELLRAVV